jgi:hypothetical protein
MIGDIKFLALDFESYAFSFPSRKTNVVAHILACCVESLFCNISVGVAPEHFVMMLFDRCRPHSLKEKQCSKRFLKRRGYSKPLVLGTARGARSLAALLSAVLLHLKEKHQRREPATSEACVPIGGDEKWTGVTSTDPRV